MTANEFNFLLLVCGAFALFGFSLAGACIRYRR